MSMRYACELYHSIDDVNADYKLYFNITFRGLDQGLVPGVRIVHFGASADEFKHRYRRQPVLPVRVRTTAAMSAVSVDRLADHPHRETRRRIQNPSEGVSGMPVQIPFDLGIGAPGFGSCWTRLR